ncbi:MAG: hypothetical protein J5J00_13550 [Deltaproteobacteria bacterium]|nr:hypothetical protein [Deltaproteobacteria bacterium]
MAWLIKSVFKLSLVVAAFAALLVVAVYFSLKTNYVSSHLIRSIESMAAPRGVTLKLGSLEPTTSGVKARNIDAFFNKYFLSLQIAELAGNFEWMSLLRGQLSGMLDAELYGGHLRVQGGVPVSAASSGEWLLSASNLKLTSHPQIAGLGFTDGTLRARATGYPFPDNGPASGKFEVNIENLVRPVAASLQLRRGTTLQLPQFTVTAASAAGELKESLLMLDQLAVSSTLGTLTGAGAIPIHRSASGEFKFDVALSADGVSSIGQSLPELTQGALIPENDRFSCTLAFAGGSSRLECHPIS